MNTFAVKGLTGFLVLGSLLLFSCATVDGGVEEPNRTGESSPTETAAVYLEAGREQTEAWDLQAARESYRQALAAYAGLDDRSGSVQALLALGWNAWQNGDPASAAEYYRHGRLLADAGDDSILRGDVMNHQADLALRLGDPVEATGLLGDRSHPAGRVEAARLRLLGTARYSMGETETAMTLLEEAVMTARESGEPNEEAQACYRMATILSSQASFKEAEVWALQALDADRRAGYGPGVAADLRALALIAEGAEDLNTAEDYYRRAWLAWQGLGREGEADRNRRDLEKLSGRAEFLP